MDTTKQPTKDEAVIRIVRRVEPDGAHVFELPEPEAVRLGALSSGTSGPMPPRSVRIATDVKQDYDGIHGSFLCQLPAIFLAAVPADTPVRLRVEGTDGRLVYESLDSVGRIERRPDVLGGRATVAGHRVAVADVVRVSKSETTPGRIWEIFPSLCQDDIDAALAYYDAHRAEIDDLLGP